MQLDNLILSYYDFKKFQQENGQIAPTNPPGGSAYRNFSNVIILISTLLSAILI